MRLSRIDAVAYALMVGLGEAYFVADGVRLGASALEIALLVGLPLAIGAAGPVLVLHLLAKVGRRKPIVLAAASAQIATLLLLSWLSHNSITTPRLLIGVAALYQLCVQAAGAAWNSWFGDLVPAQTRGRYFASRNRGAYAGTLLGLLAGGAILSRLEPAGPGASALLSEIGGAGFAVIYAAAAGARCLSLGLQAASAEGRFSGMPERSRIFRFLKTQRGTGVWRLMLLIALLQATVCVSAPFFNPYMLEQLSFSYIEYTAAVVCVVAFKVLLLPLWGAQVDRRGARAVLLSNGLLIALIPLPWVLVGGLWPVLLVQALTGAAWSGFELGHFSMLLELSYRRMRPTIFAAQGLLVGSAQLVGGLAGGALLAASIDPRAVFSLGAGLRIAAVLLMLRYLPATAQRVRPQFRITGFRPGIGLALRPIAEPMPAHPSEGSAPESPVHDEPGNHELSEG